MRSIYALALIELAVLGSLVVPIVVTLSLKVLSLVPSDQKENALGTVLAIGAAAALIANPIFGHLSDRTKSRFGRRRPWLVGGTAAGLLATIITATASNVPQFILGWALTQIAYNATLAALSALLADQVPETQRAKASGIFGAFGFLGIVPAILISQIFNDSLDISMIIDPLTLSMIIMPVIAVIIVTVICITLKDPQHTDSTTKHQTIGEIFASFLFNPLRTPQFSLVWIQRFTMQFGYVIVSTYGLFYLMTRLALDQEAAATLVRFSTLAGAFLNMIAAFGFGYLAARRGNYRPVLITSALILAGSLLLKAFTADITVFWVSTILAGFALGMYYAVDLALVMRTLPAGDEGKFLGIFNIAKTLPQSLGPAVAPLIVLIGQGDPVSGDPKNYTALYLCATIAVLLSLLTLTGLRSTLNRNAQTPAEAEGEVQAQVSTASNTIDGTPNHTN